MEMLVLGGSLRLLHCAEGHAIDSVLLQPVRRFGKTFRQLATSGSVAGTVEPSVRLRSLGNHFHPVNRPRTQRQVVCRLAGLALFPTQMDLGLGGLRFHGTSFVFLHHQDFLLLLLLELLLLLKMLLLLLGQKSNAGSNSHSDGGRRQQDSTAGR
uniref:(northern house mosquito) hypothetical protein n=1 Tax=Culex pipiens TaxID=7175 RepID=A0A8D8G559_CULPI